MEERKSDQYAIDVFADHAAHTQHILLAIILTLAVLLVACVGVIIWQTDARVRAEREHAEQMSGEDYDEESKRSMRSMRNSYADGSNRSYEGALRPVSDREGFSERNRDRMGRFSRADGGYSGHNSEELLDAIEKMLQHRD